MHITLTIHDIDYRNGKRTEVRRIEAGKVVDEAVKGMMFTTSIPIPGFISRIILRKLKREAPHTARGVARWWAADVSVANYRSRCWSDIKRIRIGTVRNSPSRGVMVYIIAADYGFLYTKLRALFPKTFALAERIAHIG